jgi:hypothetical protein
VWRVVLPKIFGYELVPNKVVLNDGTVINVVRFLFYHSFRDMTDHPIYRSLDELKNKSDRAFHTPVHPLVDGLDISCPCVLVVY